MQRIDPIVRTIANLMRMRGGEITVNVTVDGGYDPAQSKVASSVDSFQVKALVFDFIKKTDGDGTQENSLIRSGDKQVFIQADASLPYPDPQTGSVTIDGTTYRIIVVKALNPSGVASEALLFELFVRR